MKMTTSTRYLTRRMDAKLRTAAKIVERDLPREAKAIASEEGDKWSNKIRASGRGGRWNAQMSRIESSFTTPKSGSLSVRMGWLGTPPPAEDGKTTWFVYWDRGFQLFGRPGPENAMPGIMAQLDARRNLTRRFNDLAKDIVVDVERTIGGS